MATRRFISPNWGTTSSTDATSGTVSVTNAVAHSPGGYSYHVNPTTTGTGFVLINSIATSGFVNSGLSLTALYSRYYFYLGSLPAAEEIIGTWITTAGALLAKQTITSGGLIKHYDSTGALLATSSTALVAGRFYKISTEQHNGAAGAFTFYIDDVQQGTGTGNFTATTIIGARIGKVADTNGSTVDFYYADYLHSDSALPALGNSVQMYLPAVANGATQQWTAGTGASDYTQTVAIPTSGTTYVQSTGTAGDLCLVAPRDVRAYGIVPATINSVETFSRGRNNTATTNATLCRLNSGVSNSDTTASNIGSSDKTQLGAINDTDPATSSAWTQAGLLAVQIGSKENNAQATRMESYGMMVDMSLYPNPTMMLSCGVC